jgi:hypothetical protein
VSDAGSPSEPDEAGEPDERPLLLDELDERLARFRFLRKSDEAAADEVLADIGASGPVENEIVLELSATRPLGHPDRFTHAHELAMRSLEVLDRNGARPASLPRLGPLKPLAAFSVQFVTRFIVRSYQGEVIDAMRNLYARRLAWSAPGDSSRLLLLRARNDAERVTAAYKRNPIGLPTFLVGGAVVSFAAQLIRRLVDVVVGSQIAAAVAVAAVFVLFGCASWVILRGAAVARRRIRLTTERPLDALWETIGRCGKPPDDRSRLFATYGILLTALGWLIVPLGVFLVVAAF